MEAENEHKNHLDPVKEIGIVFPEHFTWELCRIFEERDYRYMHYAVREYPTWMNGEYREWFMNYRMDDDFVPGMAMALCAFYGPAEAEGVTARGLAKEYISRHYRQTHYLPDIHLFLMLMFRKQFADMITPDKQRQLRIMGYCLREVYDYENRCFRFPKKDIIIISEPLLLLADDTYPKAYEKLVINALPYTPDEEVEIRELLEIN